MLWVLERGFDQEDVAVTARLENPFLLVVHLGEVGRWGQGEREERRKARRSCLELSGQTLESLHRKRRDVASLFEL